MSTILVVDDKADITNLVKMIFEPKGDNVLSASNGKEAVERLQGASVDVVLMDLMMPEMNGYEALRAIRADERTRSLKVIACTARASKQDESQVMDAGFDGYIAKPFRVKALEEEVKKYLAS